MEDQDIRWKQRHFNFGKAMALLSAALAITSPDVTQKAGVIQFFEISFEMAWNTLKDYLEYQGHTGLRSPRDTLKKAFEVGLISDGHAWLELLNDRNLSTHIYDEEKISEIDQLIRTKYMTLLKDLYSSFEVISE